MNLVITGCDRGLGLSVTKLALADSHQVFASRFMSSETGLDELKKKHPDSLHILELDVSSDESVARAAEEIRSTVDVLDGYIGCAGILGEREIEGAPHSNHDEILKVFGTNALGNVRMTEALYPLLKNSSRKLLFYVSSEAGSVTESTRRDWFGYCMSKSALNAYAKLIFNRLTPEGFDVRVYHPGWVQTYMNVWGLDAAADLTADEAAVLMWKYVNGPAEKELVLRDCDGKAWKF